MDKPEEADRDVLSITIHYSAGEDKVLPCDAVSGHSILIAYAEPRGDDKSSATLLVSGRKDALGELFYAMGDANPWLVKYAMGKAQADVLKELLQNDKVRSLIEEVMAEAQTEMLKNVKPAGNA